MPEVTAAVAVAACVESGGGTLFGRISVFMMLVNIFYRSAVRNEIAVKAFGMILFKMLLGLFFVRKGIWVNNIVAENR